MNKIEVTALLSIIKTAYPNFYKGAGEINNAIDLWSMMFVDDSAKIVTEAVKALMCTLKFPPTIADVKEKIALITQPERMTEMEAWNMVKNAISYYHAKEGFDGLLPLLQRLVGSPNQLMEWAVMDIDDLETVVKSNFMRSYTVRARQEAERAMLPESTRDLIQQLAEGFSMGRLTDGRNK
jgi:hypothetical protein